MTCLSKIWMFSNELYMLKALDPFIYWINRKVILAGVMRAQQC